MKIMYNTPCVLLENGKLPTQAHEDDAGWDCYAREGGEIPYGGTACVPLGFKLGMRPGLFCKVVGRSGLAKRSVFAHDGTVDAGYRGEVSAILYCLNKDGFKWNIGDRVAQLVFHEVMPIHLYLTTPDLLSESSRGENGFGSSGN